MKKLLVALFCLMPLAAHAQSTGRVVADCTAGVPLAYAIGSTSMMTMLATGVACTNAGGGGGGGLSVTDQAAFTQGASQFTPSGGVFNDASTLSSGQQGTFRLTTKRAMIVDIDPTGSLLNTVLTAPLPVKAGTLPSTQTPVSTGTTTAAQSDLNGNQYANVISQYPAGAVPLTASAIGTTAATTATLAASATLKTYICSYSIRANATGTTTVQNTVTGVVTATMTHQMWVPANTAGLGVDEQIFTPCVPSSAINTAIAVVSGAPGAGGLVSATATGYQAP